MKTHLIKIAVIAAGIGAGLWGFLVTLVVLVSATGIPLKEVVIGVKGNILE